MANTVQSRCLLVAYQMADLPHKLWAIDFQFASTTLFGQLMVIYHINEHIRLCAASCKVSSKKAKAFV